MNLYKLSKISLLQLHITITIEIFLNSFISISAVKILFYQNSFLYLFTFYVKNPKSKFLKNNLINLYKFFIIVNTSKTKELRTAKFYKIEKIFLINIFQIDLLIYYRIFDYHSSRNY